jgi:hypothetical protein
MDQKGKDSSLPRGVTNDVRAVVIFVSFVRTHLDNRESRSLNEDFSQRGSARSNNLISLVNRHPHPQAVLTFNLPIEGKDYRLICHPAR